MAVRRPTPFSCLQHKRFAKQDGWLLRDLALSLPGNIIVSGSSVDSQQTLIDIYALGNDFDSRNKPKIFFSKEFEKHSSEERDYLARRAVFVDPDGDDVVTCLGDKLQVIKVSKDEVLLSRRVNGETYCLYVRGREIFVGFWGSKKINVYSVTDLTEIKSIILEGIQEGDWPHDITVTEGRIFACVGHANASSNQTTRIFDETNGRLLSELTHPTGTQWYARSLAVNVTSGVIAIVWNDSFYRVEGERWQIVFYHLMRENISSFLIVEVEPGVTRIRISDRGERTVTGNLLTGEVKIYDTAELFTYGHLKESLGSQLQRDDCLSLTNYFALSEEHANAIVKSETPIDNLLIALEEKGIIQPSNVDRLTEAFLELKIKSSCFMLADTYQKTRTQATPYGRFLASLSTHLTASLPEDLCTYFNIADEKKTNIIANHNPGLSLLLALDEMGIINPSEVGALVVPFTELSLVQTVAKIEEYQSIMEERMILQLQKKAELTKEEKKKVFIHCLKKKIKGWYETMTPVPWKKSCRWKSTELFIGRKLILTDSKDKRSLKDIDENCMIAYDEVLSHTRLKLEPRIILEGDPGSGKTMLMSQLAYDWSVGKFNEIEMLILLPLKCVQQQTLSESIKEFYLPEDNRLSIADVESFLQNEEICTHLLLDGLEEYTGKVIIEEQSEVKKIMSKVKYPQCKVVISSRSDYFQNLPKYPMLKLKQFGKMERDSYIERVFSDDLGKQMEMKEVMNTSSFMVDLCSTPLLFVMAVHNIGRTESLLKGQLDRISPFMRDMIETLCSSSVPTDQLDHQSADVKSENVSHLHDSAFLDKDVQLSENAKGRETMHNTDVAYHLKEDHTDESFQDIASEKLTQFGVTELSSKSTRPRVKKFNVNVKNQLHKETTQFEKAGQSEAVCQSNVEALSENEVCSGAKKLLEDSQGKELKIEEMKSLSLNELAFNGLCRGIQQLSWQREFVERNVFESKKWIACGLLVTEEGLLTLSKSNHNDFQGKQLNKQFDNDNKSINDDQTRNEAVQHTTDGQFEKTKSFEKEKVTNASSNLETQLEKERSKDIDARGNKILTQVSMQVKFLHKLFQEWFAAKELSSLMWKSMFSNLVRECVNEHLQYISPADLHYILRFTCFLCPPSLHYIVKFLLQSCHSGRSNVQNYVMNCIFLCFAEYNGKDENDILEAIADVCHESIILHRDDSRFLQQAKIAVLERASNNWIPIRKLTLADCVVSATEDVLTFNSGIKMTVLDTIEMLEVRRWDETLKDKDCSSIIKFISRCCSTKEARLYLPYRPPDVEETTVASLRREDKIVTWIIGAKMTQILDTTTGKWVMESNTESAKFMDTRHFSDYQGSVKANVLSVESTISMHGGLLQIPETDVSLWVPPDAIEDDKQQFRIQLRIIPPDSYDEPSAFFSSNSSSTVELLPNHLKFKHPVRLTLPHCLQLKKDVEYKARIFMSHSEEENKPKWEEMTNLSYQLDDRMCTIWINTFCWMKVEIDGDIVEAKKIKVYTAAKPICVPDDIAEIEVGYHLDLPGAGEMLRWNPSFVVEQVRPFLFLREGQHPLMVSFEKVVSRTWSYSTPENNPKEIPFRNVASSTEYACPFLFEQDQKRYDIPTCIFKASQNGEYIELNIRPKILPASNPFPRSHSSAELEYRTLSYFDPNRTLESSPSSNITRDERNRNWRVQNVSPYSAQFGQVNIPYLMSDEDTGGVERVVLSYGLIKAIAKKLDPPDPLGNDWKQLADELGFTIDDIAMFGTLQSSTWAVIDCAIKSAKLKSLDQLKGTLEQIGRSDAASLIKTEDSKR